MDGIVKLGTSDAHWLSLLASKTYLSSYENVLTSEEIDTRLKSNYSEEQFLLDLKDGANSFFGMQQSSVWIGYLHLRQSDSPPNIQDKNVLQLSRIYLETSLQSKGHGRQLLRFAEDFALKHQYQGLWLHCYDQNLRALRFYHREGYKSLGLDPFKITSIVRNDVLLIKLFNDSIEN
ncbi:MAG: Acetyltransferase, family [Bacteriovoracaceae bacterium]|nr:Acetyltransferase, family [Bacteriovoracaceae bacterium]